MEKKIAILIKFTILTLGLLYILIAAGSIVRSTGSGMGCPDWPKCFGQWVPPTSEAELPANYHEIYAERGYQNTQFNPTKTWTEYTNRLVGVSIGLLIFLTAVSSRIFLKSDKTIFYLSLTSFFLVGFQGWLGSSVVASNLKPVVITLHMLLALVIVALSPWAAMPWPYSPVVLIVPVLVIVMLAPTAAMP
jgi:cytochrome c oxidase assembly protein subunit 15